jgi:hypothetical protein
MGCYIYALGLIVAPTPHGCLLNCYLSDTVGFTPHICKCIHDELCARHTYCPPFCWGKAGRLRANSALCRPAVLTYLSCRGHNRYTHRTTGQIHGQTVLTRA